MYLVPLFPIADELGNKVRGEACALLELLYNPKGYLPNYSPF